MTLKKNESIPDDNHIVRRVSWANLLKDEDNNVLGILPQAFKMKDTENELSANWLEYFPGSFNQQVVSVVQEIRKRVAVKPKSGFAIGKVGEIKNMCKIKGYKTRIVYSNSSQNPSHVDICLYPREDMELFELLATEAWSHLVLNNSVPT
jgi:hypothetical protein